MKFNTAIPLERKEAMSYFMKLTNRKLIVEVKKVNPKRTLSQNSYLHLIISYFGVHFGYTLEEAKQVYKEVNHGIYRYEKKGRVFWRSSADLNKDEMAQTIDTFMQRSKEAGCPLPPATDQAWLREIEKEIERSNYYLRG